MALNLASLNVRGLRDSSKCTRLLAELKNLGVDVAAVQETHFTCGADCRVLESDFNVFSACDSRTSSGVSLLVGRSLDADVDVVFAGDGGRLVVADVAMKSFKFRLVAVYASNIAAEKVSFFRRLAPLSLELGARIELLEQLRVLVTWRLARNALPLRDLNFKAGLADMPDCPRCSSGLEETAEHAFYYCGRVRPFWDHVGSHRTQKACAARRWLRRRQRSSSVLW